ncbi:MAG: outer membrane protein transport protein [Xanthomonadales bacterium]|nr:outer membrane protein transport protein [Xanthomonadales bacterium]
MRPKLLRHALCLILSGASASAFAVTNLEPNAGLQFNFSNPGARSLGLGGAFTGLADDATATYANPAGLTILRTQEFAFEGRYTNFETPFSNGGNVNFSPFDASAVGESDSSDSLVRPSFASWVYPADKLTFAAFYHRVANFESEYTASPITINGGPNVIFGYDTSLDFAIENVGLSLAYQMTESFSLGLSAAYSDFEISSVTTRSQQDPLFANQQTQFGGDNDVVFTAGLLWRLSPQWNVGLAWREGGEFSYKASNATLPGNAFHPNSRTERTTFNVPNVISAGVAFRPSDNWLFTLDVNRVHYSDLTDAGVTDLFSSDESTLKVEDGTEIRLGVEYAFLDMERPFFVRGGVWRDPEHRLTIPNSITQDCNSSDFNFFGCIDATLFRPGDDEMHYSLGLGWAFDRFQIDAAADFSDLVDTYSVSGVLRF